MAASTVFLAGLFYVPVTLIRLIALIRRKNPGCRQFYISLELPRFRLPRALFASFRLVVSFHGDDVKPLTNARDSTNGYVRQFWVAADAITRIPDIYLAN